MYFRSKGDELPRTLAQVLEASDNLEVIEIGVPAVHMTTIDHEMTLPTAQLRPEREFQGQTFCHHQVAEATWLPWRIQGFEHRDTGIHQATKGVASVQVVRPDQSGKKPRASSHDWDILFSFVLKGSLDLQVEGYGLEQLKQGDAWVMPPGLGSRVVGWSGDLEFLEVGVVSSIKLLFT